MNTDEDLETLAPPADAPAPVGTAAAASALAASLALAACGGGSEDDAARPDAAAAGAGMLQPQATAAEIDAFRLLTQATFGPTAAGMTDVKNKNGALGWINWQLGLAANKTIHLNRWNAAYAGLGEDEHPKFKPVTSSFFERALTAPDQLRQRVAFALSQIFVVSTVDLTGNKSQAIASYLDMLNEHAFGTYRNLLEKVSLHPAMGMYLSTLNNKREIMANGRIPDQNYAREVMQLFSIGLVHLNLDGTQREPVQPTYDQDDIVGMSRIFTGYKYDPTKTEQTERTFPMVCNEPNHSREQKKFLSLYGTPDVPLVDIPKAVGGVTDPAGDLKKALDALATHPNTAPFISRQLIQRLVTSHPSGPYVQAVAQEFKNTGGNIGAVVRKILTHPEARTASTAPDYGKLREPVLRLTAYLRANNVSSKSGRYWLDPLDDPATQLGQSPLHSPTVFNFFRPGFRPLQGQAALHELTVPEMQITSEVSVAGYINFMADTIEFGLGLMNGTVRDIKINPTPLTDVADTATTLADKVIDSLLGPGASALTMNAPMRSAVVTALNRIPTSGTDRAAKRLRRVRVALTMVLASPEFIVQR